MEDIETLNTVFLHTELFVQRQVWMTGDRGGLEDEETRNGMYLDFLLLTQHLRHDIT